MKKWKIFITIACMLFLIGNVSAWFYTQDVEKNWTYNNISGEEYFYWAHRAHDESWSTFMTLKDLNTDPAPATSYNVTANETLYWYDSYDINISTGLYLDTQGWCNTWYQLSCRNNTGWVLIRSLLGDYDTPTLYYHLLSPTSYPSCYDYSNSTNQNQILLKHDLRILNSTIPGTSCNWGDDNEIRVYETAARYNTSQKFIEVVQTFNSSTYETARESFIMNISVGASTWSSVSGSLVYNGTPYTGTKTGTDNLTFVYNMDMGTVSGQQNKTFYWNITLTNSTGTFYSQSSVQNQTIDPINLTLCGASPQDTPFLNFTFKDEATDTLMSARTDLTDFDYWLGGGSVTRSFIMSDSSVNPNYAFCLNPPDRAVNVDLQFKYSNATHPLRTFVYDEKLLTNATTNQILYLLGTSDGIYTTVQVIESSGAVISGTTIQVERQFSGVWTLIEQGTTGSDGAATFWLNPNFEHRITASKTSYVTSQQTITPSQSLYTMTLQKSTGDAGYTSEIEGLRWTFYPSSGSLVPATHNFNATVTSSLENLENCKLELINSTGSVIDTDTSITNTSYCFVNIDYTVPADSIFFARLSVDTTNSTGFVIVDADWKFLGLERAVKDWRTLKSFFTDVQDLAEFGEGEQAEFSRLILFFLLTTIFVGMFMYFTGSELQSPGINMILIWVIAVLASVAGFLTIELGSPQATAPLEQYGLAFILTLVIINYVFVITRRAND